MRFTIVLFQLLFYLLFGASAWAAPTLNGFDLEKSLIPVDEILRGGPPKDGIPALDSPRFVATKAAKDLNDDDIVLGLAMGKQAKAYPIRIMNWHEVVNDRFGNMKVVVTYCPLCGSGVAFNARVGDRVLDFGVSGLLYNSDVLLYDRQTQSLWSQLEGKAVTGALASTPLTAIPMQQTTWGDWRKQYPKTQVLDFNTGHRRNYARDPYKGYEKTRQLYFPVEFRAKGLHPKEKVVGLKIGKNAKAWPFVELHKGSGTIDDRIGETKVRVTFDKATGSAVIMNAKGQNLPSVILYWFAWSAFHPNTEIYRVSE